MLELLEDELISAMGLIGVTSIGEVTPQYVCKAEAVTPPHEMLAWVSMPVGSILYAAYSGGMAASMRPLTDGSRGEFSTQDAARLPVCGATDGVRLGHLPEDRISRWPLRARPNLAKGRLLLGQRTGLIQP
jgi:hypothetical protein